VAELLKSPYGNVRPYTRHLRGCEFSSEADHNSCSCPKWLYTNQRGERPRRYTLNTPSMTEAVKMAIDTLKGFDPEIAEARRVKVKKKSAKKTVEEAVHLWLDRTRSSFGDDADIVKQYRSTFGWRDRQGKPRGNFLLYLERYNEGNAADPVHYIQDITPLFCQQWHNSWKGKYADQTRKQRWGTVRSFFSFLHNLGVIENNPALLIRAIQASQVFAHVPFTDEQFQRILDEADWYVDDRVKDGEREFYCRRTHLFLKLLRYTGMDVGDAVMFQTSLIRDERIDGKAIPILRYRRKKTRVEAVIVLDPKLAEALRKIPEIPDSVPDRPFRYRGSLASSDAHNWSRRISQLIKLAKIGRVQLVNRDGTPAVDDRGSAVTRNPNVKMLRHTFAIAQLLKGLRPEAVAKQLGHVDTAMIFRHYAPWCKERDLAHIREQL